jgi:hypothetical protein
MNNQVVCWYEVKWSMCANPVSEDYHIVCTAIHNGLPRSIQDKHKTNGGLFLKRSKSQRGISPTNLQCTMNNYSSSTKDSKA